MVMTALGYRNLMVHLDMKIHAMWYENQHYLGIKTLVTTFLWDSTLHTVRVTNNSYYSGIRPFYIVMMALATCA